jgi:hypothetical protein
MAIKPSASTEIRTLTAALASPDDVTRESAVARLAILGARAVDRVTAAYPNSDRGTRAAILRVLEAIADPRAIAVARQALAEGDEVGVAAASALRALLDSPVMSAATDAFDALVATAMDVSVERRVRLAAFDALQDMPDAIRERVADALRAEGDPGMLSGLSRSPSDAATAELLWREAAEGNVGDSPSALRDALKGRGASAALGVLQKMIDAVRVREGAVTAPQREAWRSVRGALHQALALRGSNVAVYDLRETLEATAEPMPPTFLTALHVVGDESCLEPIAAAYSRTADERWRRQLIAAFEAIAKRAKITARSPALKRIATRWPQAARALSTTSRTRPRQTPRRRT